MESFHMKCHWRILGIRWHDRIRNTVRVGLPPLMDLIARQRNTLVGHTDRLADDTPAHQSIRRHIDISIGQIPDSIWKRPPCRPRIAPTKAPAYTPLIYGDALFVEVMSGVTQRSRLTTATTTGDGWVRNNQPVQRLALPPVTRPRLIYNHQ